MFKAVSTAVLMCVAVADVAPAEMRMCGNSHGKYFRCNKVVAPRINLKAKHPVKVQRCRGHVGRFNKC